MKSLAVILFVTSLSCCVCNNVKKKLEAHIEEISKSVPDVKSEISEKIGDRKQRSYAASLMDFVGCLNGFDSSCVINKAENILIETNRNFWAEADNEVSRTTSREGDEKKPSALMNSISQIISELTDMLKDGLSGLFRDAKEDDEEGDADGDDEKNTDDDEDKDENARNVEESRGKKKKKKKAITKLLILGAVVATKIKLLLKLLATHLQIKFFFIALAGLLLNFARFYLELKKGHQPQKVIYYEHAQHQHHYDGGEEDWHGGWSRSYNVKDEKSGQDLAYAQQKPQGLVYNVVSDKPNYSWGGGN